MNTTTIANESGATIKVEYENSDLGYLCYNHPQPQCYKS